MVGAVALRGLDARPRPRSPGHFALISGLAALLAVVGHGVGGGALPTSCVTLAVVVALAVGATGAAALASQRTRGLWASLVALAAGQLAVEALLSVPVNDLPAAPLAAAAVHGAAALALGVVLLGVDRTVEDLSNALDRVLTRWWRQRAAPVPRRRPRCVPVLATLLVPAELGHDPRSLRGPPALA